MRETKHKEIVMHPIRLAVLMGCLILGGLPARAVTQYWDASTNAGYQHGDGNWTAQPLWTTSGVTGASALGPWVDGSDAYFNSSGTGSSAVVLNGAAVTAASCLVYYPRYTLVVTNGGDLTVSGNCLISYGSNAKGNDHVAVLGGPGVTSRWTALAGVRFGEKGGNGNTLTVDGLGSPGSAVFDGGTLDVGYAVNASPSNILSVRRGGRLLAGTFRFGYNNSYGRLTVSDGGVYQGSGAFQIGWGTSNGVLVEESGLVTNAGAVRIGASATAFGNSLAVTGGGRVYSGAASAVGYTTGASNNSASVTGPGSLWDLGGQNLTIGSVAMTGNVLTIDRTGRVAQVSLLLAATNNMLVLAGGTLEAGRIGFTNDAPFAVGDGIQAAALVLTNKALSGFSPGLRVSSNAVLQGSATLACGPAGLAVAAGGAFSPGVGGIGVFTNSGSVALEAGSETVIELGAAAGPGAGWDHLAVTNGALSLGGVLKPVLRGAFVPEAGDRFVIMTNRGPGSVTDRFDNAADGQWVTVYGADGVSRSGQLKVEIGAQGVTLGGYRATRATGAFFIIR